MNKPTHILLPIDYFETHSITNSNIDNLPQIDLSERNIEQAAYDYTVRPDSHTFRNEWERQLIVDGYKNCAKDLLNIKP